MTLTVSLQLAVVFPVQLKPKVWAVEIFPVTCVPDTGFDPLQAPVAVHESAFTADQFNVVGELNVTGLGDAAMVQVV